MHVPNNYDFIDNPPVAVQGKGGASVEQGRTDGDFTKTYTSRNTSGKKVEIAISRIGDTYKAAVVK